MSFEVIIPFLKPIENLLASKTVSEIMVNPDGSIWIEENGQILRATGVQFDGGTLQTALEVIANRFGKKLDANSPILNLRLPDGSRMAAMIPPVVNPQPLMTIRKFTSRGFNIHDLIERRMLTESQAGVLTKSVERGDNMLISGGTGSGKTTLTNVLASFIPEAERIVVLEDTAELYIRRTHVISAEAQLDTHKSKIDFGDLLKAALRHRPDRIIVGEIRGAEARVFLDALNTGHRGSIATIHANGAKDALRRLGHLATRAAGGLTVADAEQEARNSMDMVVHIAKIDGLRSVRELLQLQSA